VACFAIDMHEEGLRERSRGSTLRKKREKKKEEEKKKAKSPKSRLQSISTLFFGRSSFVLRSSSG